MPRTVRDALEDVITPLGTFLVTHLQAVNRNWWEEMVLNCLTEGQLRNIQSRKITKISELDLAALLRVFDSNWNLISQRQEIIPEFRNILKEMRSIRNRWSHAGASGYPKEDIYRDLDTINRFAKEIGADTSLLNSIKKLMAELLSEISAPVESQAVSLQSKIKIKVIEDGNYYADILSVAAGQTKAFVDRYHIHSCPDHYDYEKTKYITFRVGGTGKMDALYEINKILIVPMDARGNLEDLVNHGLSYDEVQRLKNYMIGISSMRDMRLSEWLSKNDRYYVLSWAEELTHRPRPDEVGSETRYYSLSELLKEPDELKFKESSGSNLFGEQLDQQSSVDRNDESKDEKTSWNKFSGKDLSRQKLVGNNFENADLEHTNFSESNLQEVNFRGAFIHHTNFYRADLRDSNFQDATLLNVNLNKANLCGADLSFKLVRLSGRTLKDGHISCKQILSSFIDQKTKLPEYMKIHWENNSTYSLTDLNTGRVYSNNISSDPISEEPKRTDPQPSEETSKIVNDDGGSFGWLIVVGVICLSLWVAYRS
jgi:hypothetical protein